MRTFYEFFAGGGMARAGLGAGWHCLFANDFDLKKSRTYECFWGTGVLKTADVHGLTTDDLPGCADLAWASFPCQDLSLAGSGAGLNGNRSGTFWPFWSLIQGLGAEGRAPGIIVLENVCGTLTSHNGKDFAAICTALRREGYRFGAVVIDASWFVPQSRPRLFVIAVRELNDLPSDLTGKPSDLWHPDALVRAVGALSAHNNKSWVWWSLPKPPTRRKRFADLVEDEPDSAKWHTGKETAKLIGMMNGLHRDKLEKAKRVGRRMVGTVYKRTRRDEEGNKVQRAEIRFDDVAGCLRTPVGGSSRQLIVVVDGDIVRSRLISTRETARLMGLPDRYPLPSNYNEAYHVTGDGVVVPVVRHLARHLLEPLLDLAYRQGDKAA